MSGRSRRYLGLALAGTALAVVAVSIAWYRSRRGPAPGDARSALPRPGSATYEEMVSAFSAGVAALDVDAGERANTMLTRAIELVSEEPAAWADRGLYAIRLNDYDAAARDLGEAARLAPESGAIERLWGLLEGRRGRFAEAVGHLRRAIELDPSDLKARYALVQEIERQGGTDADAEILGLLGEILERQPDNLVALLDRARLAAKRGDAAAFRDAIARLSKLAPSWSQNAQAMLREIETAEGINPRTATRVAFLRNLLVRVPAFARSLDALEPPRGTVGEPIRRFLALEQPPPTPAPADEAVTFAIEPLERADETRGEIVAAAPLAGAPPTVVLAADGRGLRLIGSANVSLPFPGGPAGSAPSPNGVLAADLDSDYRMDLILAGAGGLRLFHQQADGTFDDATEATGLDPVTLAAAAHGVWAADVEMDGDLDLVVGLVDGETPVLRNHGDGAFTVVRPFAESRSLRDFAWADLDGDGDPDAALLEAGGTLRIMTNERAGTFRPRPVPDGLDGVAAVAVADADADGALDLVVLRGDGELVRLSDRDDGLAWDTALLGARPLDDAGTARLLVADLDNNGSPDLIATGRSGGWIWLGQGPSGFRPVALPSGLRVFAASDLTDDGRLDLIGLSPEGRPVCGVGRGSKDYRWQALRPRAAKVVGDGRINSFGLGGEVELRAGLLAQKQVISGPVVHFGLGEHAGADVVRLLWPNGTVQAEFETKAGQVVLAEQRLKGSCPFLFARGATGTMGFVTDFLWRSPLGLRINAQDTAGVGQTEDWVKIRGDQLAARDGYYDLSITAELWETHYFDRMELMVVDHPDGTEVFVDERFARQPPPLAVHPTGPLRPIRRASDDAGRDVTKLVRSRDGRYLDTFERTSYQGIARDHWVEVELDEETSLDRPLWLVAHGWVHPTDSSINVALGQGRHEPPRGLALEVPTAGGGWAVAEPDLGFPAGKNKTIIVRLDDALRPGAPRRFRLRTNLEVYWDELAIADGAADTPVEVRRLAPTSAELRPRGYSLMTQADAGSPELPEYGAIAGTAQRWLDLVGFYTRFGDVRELLQATDDRYVIANAGDEVALRFAAPPPPPEGWRRDFVMIGDGWNKDGDYNTAFSKTVLPLPAHDRPDYSTPPGELENDPVYRRYPEDWRMYHTRYVTPRAFRGALRPPRENAPPGPGETGR
jgi:tetratricopeptide (TPR) repeat protein